MTKAKEYVESRQKELRGETTRAKTKELWRLMSEDEQAEATREYQEWAAVFVRTGP